MHAEKTIQTKAASQPNRGGVPSAQNQSAFFARNPTNSFFIQRDPQPESASEPSPSEATATPNQPAPAVEEPASGGGSNRDYLGELVGGLVEDQIGNTGLRGHINTLAEALQSLAEDTTDDVANDPDRLGALGVSGAFRNASSAIMSDSGLSAFRQALIETISENDEAALITALAAGIAAYFLDVGLAHDFDFDLDEGATMGTDFDFGSIQNIQFNRLRIFIQYASTYFQSRSTVGVRHEIPSPDAESTEIESEDYYAVDAMGQIRLGTELFNLTGRYLMGSDGRAIFTGIINAGYDFGNGNRIAFATDVTHNVQEDETIIRPGLQGRFNLGNDQQLRVGANAAINTDEGLESLSGYVEYQRSWMQLRVEGNMEGIAGDNSLGPITDEGDFEHPLFFQAVLRGAF